MTHDQQAILSRVAAVEATRQAAQQRHDANAARAAEQELELLRQLYEWPGSAAARTR